MIDHIWSVVCGRSTTDRESNNISLFEIIEQINLLGPVGPIPEGVAGAALPLSFEVVSLWSRSNHAEPEESTGRIRMVAPNGMQMLENIFTVNLAENVRMRTQMKSMFFPLSGVGTGRYTFTVEIQRANGNWEVVARIPVQVETMAQVPVANVEVAH